MRRGRAAVALAVVLTIVAGCGGSVSSPSSPASPGSPEAGGAPSGPVRFEQQGFEITFAYPAAFAVARELELGTTAGSRERTRAAIGLDRDNVIFLSRYELRAPVTRASVASVRAEADSVLASLAGWTLRGKRVSFGGLHGFEYAVGLTSPQDGHSRVVVLFDRTTDYFFNCQSTPDIRPVLDAACTQALQTVKPR